MLYTFKRDITKLKEAAKDLWLQQVKDNAPDVEIIKTLVRIQVLNEVLLLLHSYERSSL